MSKVCYICNKERQVGHNVSHSKRRTKRTFGANLASIKMTINGKRMTVPICMRCLKTISKPAVPGRAGKKATKKTA